MSSRCLLRPPRSDAATTAEVPGPETGAQLARVTAWGRVLIPALALGLLAVLGRVVQLKTAPADELREAMGPRLSARPELARRGDLLDARGRLLATSRVGHRLFVDPGLVEDVPRVADALAPIVAADAPTLDRRITKAAARGRRYAAVAGLLTPAQAEAVRRADLRGVGLEPRLVREYPQGPLAAGLIGAVGFEHTGQSGCEHALEDRLAPRQGRLAYVRDARRRPLWLEAEGYEPAADGADVRLTLDVVVQRAVETRLRAAVARFNAAGGRAVVLDCRDGGLLALAAVGATRREEAAADGPGASRRAVALARNRCVSDPYEPGSTLKPFVWALATELGVAAPPEIVPTPHDGRWRTPYGRVVRDVHHHGPMSWRDVLVRSVNTGMAIVAERLTHEQMREALRRFGFGERSGSGLPGESAGIVTPAARWSDYTQTSVAIGHEVAVTPLQMVRAFSAFARDGTLAPVGITQAAEPVPARRRACAPQTARLVREVLRDVVREGTGRPAQSQRYELFGKTGTAQLPRPDGGGYFEQRYVSSFVAGAPFGAPRIVVLVVIDDPDRSRGHYGGPVAGPAVRDIVEATLAYVGVDDRAR